MKEEKAIINKEYYERITPRIGYYMKNKNIARIFKEKCLKIGFDAYAQYPT